MKILTTPRLERCIGCHSCSLACARLVHQRLSWDMAGIRIASSGGLSTGFEARTCLACNPAPCELPVPPGTFHSAGVAASSCPRISASRRQVRPAAP
jgi:Fe-S-cluster-containing dehydrogenase component